MSKKESNDGELIVLKNWHLKIAILSGIIFPSIVATGAFYGVKQQILENKSELTERVSKLELDTNKTYADKTSMQNLDTRMQRIENDITEIKTLLKNKLR